MVALYPAAWGVTQLIFGPLSDRVGRKALIFSGMALQGLGVWTFVLLSGYGYYLLAAVLAGIGTAMVYPTLQAFVSDVAHPSTCANGCGISRQPVAA